jgi:probable HAF family extracellular repeat protein
MSIQCCRRFRTPVHASDRPSSAHSERVGRGQGYFLKNGEFTPTDKPGAAATAPFKINERGQIAGLYSEVSDVSPLRPPFRAFFLDKGTYPQIEVPGAFSTQAFGLNDRGQVVGSYIDAEGTNHGFMWDDGVISTIDVPGALGTAALGINRRIPRSEWRCARGLCAVLGRSEFIAAPRGPNAWSARRSMCGAALARAARTGPVRRPRGTARFD